MDRSMMLFLGCVLTFGSAWLGLVLAPYVQLDREQPLTNDLTNTTYPQPATGIVADGRDIYRANGCMYCHSQQVRPQEFGNDIERGWGSRRSVSRDYIYNRPIMIGTMRTGPDLANIAVRQPSADWHHKHLYNPQMMVPGSIMAPFAFLYDTRKIVGEPSEDALQLTGSYAPPDGYEVVPTYEADALVAYLLSLDQSYDLPEARE